MNRQIWMAILACATITFNSCAAEPAKDAPAPKAEEPKPAATVMPPAAMQPFPAAPQIATNINQETLIKAMQARSEIDALNKKLLERKNELCETNLEIKKLREEMRGIQKQIDEILAADEKLNELKAELLKFQQPPTLPRPIQAPAAQPSPQPAEDKK